MHFILHTQALLLLLQKSTASPVKPRAELSDHKNATTNATAIVSRMPAHAWDSHMHVTSPEYALASDAAYVPSLHTVEDLRNFHKTIGIPNTVLVQPSIYGNDNACLLDGLREIGPRHGRGVVAIDPATPNMTQLQEWHRLGVRGVRLNLRSTDSSYTEKSLTQTLHEYADIVRPLGWVLELYIGMEAMPILENIVPNLNVSKVAIAHFGAPTFPAQANTSYPFDPYQLEGFQSLVNLLEAGTTWVKFSAPYRFDDDAEIRGIESIGRELLYRADDRIVFASDWPHTRFEGLDIKPFVEKCLDWTEDAGLTEEVFCLNAEELWDVNRRRYSKGSQKSCN